jgi:hypothetical protein
MGQYYKTICLDKQEFIMPHAFGEGLKLLEFGTSANGTLTALALLLADGNGRGGGDLRANPENSSTELVDLAEKLIGSWAGSRIVISGDYADAGKFIDSKVWKKKLADPASDINLYSLAEEAFTDISKEIIAVMTLDSYLAEQLAKTFAFNIGWSTAAQEVVPFVCKLNPAFDGMFQQAVKVDEKRRQKQDQRQRQKG